MDTLSPSWLAIILLPFILVTDALWRFIQGKAQRKGLRRPPGPIHVPILGSVLSINREEPWKTYTDWNALYGDVFYFRLLDQDVVVLGSQSVAVELLEKRSRIYSDRPFVATHAPFGVDINFAFAPYGENWRSCRRIVHQTFRADASITSHAMQLKKSIELANSMFQSPDRFEHHYTIFSAAVSLSPTYGYDPKAENDPLIDDYKASVSAAAPATKLETATTLRLFPFLLNIPGWFPGSGLKHEARISRDLIARLTEIPFRYTEERMKTSQHPIVSLVSDHLSQISKYADPSNQAEYISVVRKAATSTFTAASGTTASSLMAFTHAMVTHPHVWKRAQAEIDASVGVDRIPTFNDRSILPYVDAIVRETIRWRPAVPLGMNSPLLRTPVQEIFNLDAQGIWHATTDNDIYNSQYIPKGTTVIANIWAMSRDERQYPNANKFIPERFLNDDGTLNSVNHPMNFVFGFGRRICPGRYFADASLFIAISTMLSLFEFHIPDQGDDVAAEMKCLNGVTRHPRTFPCRISARPHANKAYLEHLLSELGQN